MNNSVDPKKFGLSPRIIIQMVDDNHYAIVKDRKSRIIMKDGLQIESIARSIWKVQPGAEISLKTNAPICSKTSVFLNELSIGIISL